MFFSDRSVNGTEEKTLHISLYEGVSCLESGLLHSNIFNWSNNLRQLCGEKREGYNSKWRITELCENQ